MFNYKHTLSFLLFTIMLMVQPPTRILISQAGELDPSFGDMGRLITNIEMFPNAALLQSDGKILVASTFFRDFDNTDFLLVRLYTDGRVDETFGIGGQVVTDIFPGLSDGPSALAIQPDGKILVAGGSRIFLRYLPTGALDPSFDQDGILIFDLGYGGSINAIKILPDGCILAIGVSAEYAYSNRLVLARFLPDGRLDTSFGNEGKITYENDYGIGSFRAAGVAGVLVQPDGRFIVGGSVSFKQRGGGTHLWRFHPHGSPDESFGLNGKVYIENFYTQALVFQPDGKIVTAAQSFTGPDFASLLMRFTSNGSLDPSFGLNGKAFQDPDGFDEVIYDIQYQTDGKLLVSGKYRDSDFLLRRYLADGSPDITFGSNGKVTTDFMNFDLAQYLRLYLDGRILAVGSTIDDEGFQFLCLARYLNDWPILSNHIWFPIIKQ